MENEPMRNSNVVDLNSARERRERPSITTPGEVASTGTKPFKCQASDGHYYWCKQLHTQHGASAAINEVVVSVIADALGAPVPDWSILNVPEELVGRLIGDGIERIRLSPEPVFGSRILHYADRELDGDLWVQVSDDNNYQRIPLLCALMVLCNAEDIQYLLDSSNDNAIWGFDFGWWFGSGENVWGLGESNELGGQTELPALREQIPATKWDHAIDAVRALPGDLETRVMDALPTEWDVPEHDVTMLIEYVYRRKDYTVERLEELKNRHGMGG